MDHAALTEHLSARQSEMIAALAGLVERESPTTDKPSLDALSRHLAERFGAAGAVVTVYPTEVRGDHLLVRFPAGPGGEDARPALILAHFDTVWALGTLETRPFRVGGDKAWGPGAFDMKAGIVIAEFAVRALADLGVALPRPVEVLLTSDEEIGSPTSHDLIAARARGAEYVLVLEPALGNGALKTARKGVGGFTLRIEGREAHAGVEPQRGVSAVQELANQILYLHGLSDAAKGTTVNVGVVRGGSRPNVVAGRAEAEIDVRVWTMAEAERVERAIKGIGPTLPGARVVAEGRFEHPPMERTEKGQALFGRACEIARGLGLTLEQGSTGGASDGNTTAALGVPTLDGLGAIGGGAHAADEHVLVASLPERAALLAALIAGLMNPD